MSTLCLSCIHKNKLDWTRNCHAPAMALSSKYHAFARNHLKTRNLKVVLMRLVTSAVIVFLVLATSVPVAGPDMVSQVNRNAATVDVPTCVPCCITCNSSSNYWIPPQCRCSTVTAPEILRATCSPTARDGRVLL